MEPQSTASSSLGSVHTEGIVRDALRSHLEIEVPGMQCTVAEFWLPASKGRADLVAIGDLIEGFEIKTSRDTLSRLPRQVSQYGAFFDRCTAVVAEKHIDRAISILPSWWGLFEICVDSGSISFSVNRPAAPNPDQCIESMVRLLWKKEALQVSIDLGCEPEPTATRGALWRSLLGVDDLSLVQSSITQVLCERQPESARLKSGWATRRQAVL